MTWYVYVSLLHPYPSLGARGELTFSCREKAVSRVE